MEEPWHPLLGIAAALVLAAPMWVWKQAGADWGPPVVYAILAVLAAAWLNQQSVPRTFAAFLVTAALSLGMLLPFGWLVVESLPTKEPDGNVTTGPPTGGPRTA